MEASEAQQQAPAAPEPAQPEPTPSEPAQSESGGKPDVGSEGLSALEQRLGAIEERLPEKQAEQPTSDEDLLQALLGDEEEENVLDDQQQYGDPGEQEPAPIQFESQEQFDQYLTQKAAETLHPYLLQQEMDKRVDQLNKLEEKYPDLKSQETRDQIRPILHKYADTYGNEHLATDPQLVEAVYKSLKADEASAAERPAEEAANDGASLETGAGPGSQGQSEDPEAQFKEQLLGTKSGSDAFT